MDKVEFYKDILVEYDISNDSISFLNENISQQYGVPKCITNASQYLLDKGIGTKNSSEELARALNVIKDGCASSQCTLDIFRPDGSNRKILVTFTTVFNEENQPVRAIGLAKYLRKDGVLDENNGLLYQDALLKDALLYYEANLSTQKVITGLESLFEALHIPYTDDYTQSLFLICQHIIHPSDRKRMSSHLGVDRLLAIHNAGNDKTYIEYRRQDSEKTYRWARCNVYFIDDPNTDTVKSCYYVYDNHEEKLRELDLQQKAERDLLTGLYNKGTTELLIKKELEKSKPVDSVSAFYIVDLDNFKMINDRMGHAFGDAVLSEAARKLKSLCRLEDVVGRIGGDEFILFLKNLPDKNIAVEKAQDICSIFRNAYSGSSSDFSLSGSVGVAFWPEDGATFEQLYLNADTALYTAKKQGKDSYCIYESALHTQMLSDTSPTNIDSTYRKTFSESISEYVFRILYESIDLKPAVNAVLELLSQHFGFDRCYVYELSEYDNFCFLTYQWHLPDLPPISASAAYLEEAELDACKLLVCKDDFYIFSASDNTEGKMGFPKQDNLYFRFQCALTSYGDFHGLVGFDQYRAGRPFTAYELSTIHIVAQMLGFFLEMRNTAVSLQQTKRAMANLAEDLGIYTYGMDPDTYRLTFIASPAPFLFPNVKKGDLCYKAIRKKEAPCSDCPVKDAAYSGADSCFVDWEYNNSPMKTRIVLFEQKDGKKLCILRCYQMH